MLRSLKDSGALPEAVNKRVLYYWDVGIVRNGASEQEFSLHNRPGAVFSENEKVQGKYEKPPQFVGPITVASGLNPFYSGRRVADITPDPTAITIPNTTLIEVASYIDCANAKALTKSLARRNVQECYNEENPPAGCPPPLDPTDPLDVTAMDIAHGLVEYYASYVPEFKTRACENFRASDWGQWEPDWCKMPDLIGVTPDRFDVDLVLGEEAEDSLSFENAGTEGLEYTVSSTSPLVELGPGSSDGSGTRGDRQSGVLPPGDRVEFPVYFRCENEGIYSGVIRIDSNDPDEPRVDVNFELRCVTARIGVDSPPPYQTAFNYITPAGETRSLPGPPFDFYEAGGKVELEFELEAPDWLHLPITEGRLNPGERYSDLLGHDFGEVACGDVGEREGHVIVRSNDPKNPEVQIPVRLMCAELEVVFEPDTYDDNLGLLSGVVTVRGADHLKEMYARVEDDGGGGTVLRYAKPRFVYEARLIGRMAYRWPVLHAPGDPFSPWDWSSFPEIPFVSWANTWAFREGTHAVEFFSLYRPGAFEEGSTEPRDLVANLASPSEYTITSTEPWGYIMNLSEYIERVNFYDRVLFYLQPGEKRVLHSSLMTYDWDITYYDDQGNELHKAGAVAFSPIIDLDTRYRCRFSTVSDAGSASAPYVPDARPPDFWQLNVPREGPKYRIAARWCYESYSVDRPLWEGAPWWGGEEPEIFPPIESP